MIHKDSNTVCSKSGEEMGGVVFSWKLLNNSETTTLLILVIFIVWNLLSQKSMFNILFVMIQKCHENLVVARLGTHGFIHQQEIPRQNDHEV